MKRLVPVLALAIGGLAACSKTGMDTAGRQRWSIPGELRAEIYAAPKSLNPLFITNISENMLASLAFDLLVTVDDRGNEVPDLAQTVPTLANGGISRDGRTVTYHLRRNVKWHDGVPFTSADVKFSWQAVMNPRNNVEERRGYDVVRTVDTPTAATVVFHLKAPFAPFVDTVFGESDDPFRIVPSHLLSRYPDINHVQFNSQPIGTGPFRVVKWVQGERVEYAANDAYFQGKPRLRRIIVRFVSDDNTREADLRAHSSDYANDISPTNIRDVRGVAGVKIVLAKSPYYVAVDMNLSHAPLRDRGVRAAIAAAIDTAAIVRDDTYGTADPAKADLAPFYWAYDPHIAAPSYDPGRAAALLQRAGWIAGTDGVRRNNGHPLALQLALQTGQSQFRMLATQIQAQLHAVGINVAIRTYNAGLLYASAEGGGILTGGSYDLAIYPWISGADPDDSQQWMCAYIPPNGNNVTHYCNHAFDVLQSAALGTFDRGARTRAYAKTQEQLVRDLPAVFLFYPRQRYIVNPDLKNFAPNGISEGWNASKWSI